MGQRGQSYRSVMAPAALAMMLALGASYTAQAAGLQAKTVLEKMSNEQTNAYFAGVIEGLAYSRFLRDNKEEEGALCIFSWYYESDAAVPKLISAFHKYKDKSGVSIIAALVHKDCGE